MIKTNIEKYDEDWSVVVEMSYEIKDGALTVFCECEGNKYSAVVPLEDFEGYFSEQELYDYYYTDYFYEDVRDDYTPEQDDEMSDYEFYKMKF